MLKLSRALLSPGRKKGEKSKSGVLQCEDTGSEVRAKRLIFAKGPVEDGMHDEFFHVKITTPFGTTHSVYDRHHTLVAMTFDSSDEKGWRTVQRKMNEQGYEF